MEHTSRRLAGFSSGESQTSLLSSLSTAPQSRWVIVADGALEYLPFGVLPDPAVRSTAASTSAPLITRREIVSAPSATALAMMRDERNARPRAAKAIAILADPVFSADDPRVTARPAGVTAGASAAPGGGAAGAPDSTSLVARASEDVGLAALTRLPFSRDEAAAILKLAPPAEGFQALDFRANRATALGEPMRDYRVLHFATHALLNNAHPEMSGVVLSLIGEDGQPQNGFLRLHELYNLRLNADLVVLSACQTAIGRETRGDGLQSVARGFMYAGASSVLATLWRVDDRATSEFMTRFYRQLLSGKQSSSAALKAAAIDLSRDPRWRAPYYWAGFTLQGDWK